MKTTLRRRRASAEMAARATWTTWATISAADSWRRYPICPVAQKTQPIAHPAWLLTHAVARPVYRMRTASMSSPS